jgi:hypothetical protein
MASTDPWWVACARCGTEYPENDDRVTYLAGDWYCRYEEDCDDRVIALQEAADALYG